MPDVGTHVVSAYLLGNRLKAKKLAIFLAGSIVPDLLTRTFYLFVSGQVYYYVYPLHTPFGLFFAALLCAQFFRKRLLFFKWFSLGILFHLFLDLLQKKIYPDGYSWLFPFSAQSFHIPLFWPHESLFILPFLLIPACIIVLIKKIKRKPK